MLRSSCQEIADSMGRDSEQLSEAARLRFEQHLQECEDCRRDLAASRGTRALLTSGSPVLSESARERALSRALARAEEGALTAPKRPARGWVLGGVAACAAAAGLALWLGTPASQTSTHVAREDRPAPRVEPSEAAPANVPAEAAWIDVAEPQTLQLAHARVNAEPGARLKFDQAQSILTLAEGRLEVQVDPTPGLPFQVHTQRFRVQVLGTQFSVTPEQVSVREGHVQVSDHEGRILARDLAAGASFSLHAANATEAAQKQAQDALVRKPSASSARESALVLSRVRKTMAQGQIEDARALLGSLNEGELSRAQRAESATLRAELSLLEQKPGRALEQYEELGRRFRDLPAGENAAFAAAQLAARHAPAREQALLEAYLSRYPKGRFVDEVTAKLRAKGAR